MYRFAERPKNMNRDSAVLLVIVMLILWIWRHHHTSGLTDEKLSFRGVDGFTYIGYTVWGWGDVIPVVAKVYIGASDNKRHVYTLHAYSFWDDVRRAASEAQMIIDALGYQKNVFVCVADNSDWREVYGIISIAVMMNNGVSFDDAYSSAQKGIQGFALTYDQQSSTRIAA